MSYINQLENYINELESYITKHNVTNPKVSKSTIGWQIDHSLKVIINIVNQLKNAPIDKKAKLTSLGRFCLFFKHIPRGKGKAPKQVLPPKIIDLKDIELQLEIAKNTLSQIADINKKVTFKHPFFGVLSKKQTIKFVAIHTKHHLKIIRDILKH